MQSASGIEDPAAWTVQERMLAVCHYLAATAENGPDFEVGAAGRYSDYLDGANDILADQYEVGAAGGDDWNIRHLTGYMAESIERMSGEVQDAHGRSITGRLHWMLGAMSLQMLRAGESVPDENAPAGAFDEFLVERMRVISAFPESEFAALIGLFFSGREKLHHLFRIELSAEGVVAMPKGGAAANLPPARFPVRTCLTALALELGGKPDGGGG
ncbi:MAG: hypothetical protein JNM98_18570 [Rhodocyclaceae bacterium]|nr:hypothetical protein [Rhodocyclaceae bacterium]